MIFSLKVIPYPQFFYDIIVTYSLIDINNIAIKSHIKIYHRPCRSL